MHILIIEPEQIELICEPAPRNCRYRGIRGSHLMVRLPQGIVCSDKYNWLSDSELAHVLELLDAPAGCDDTQLDQLWAQSAIESELEVLEGMYDDNPHVPGSEFFASLLRIASILRGSGREYFRPSSVFEEICDRAPQLRLKGDRQRDLAYLFGRAMNHASPRYRRKS